MTEIVNDYLIKTLRDREELLYLNLQDIVLLESHTFTCKSLI